MLLAVDIGNSAIKFGIFDSTSLVNKFSIATASLPPSADEFSSRLRLVKDRFPAIDNILACSVVPAAEKILSQTLSDALGISARFVDHRFDFGIKTAYDPITSLGLDRLINASAAVGKYGAPVIVCSFGTATTIDVVDQARTFLGGTISPGLALLARSLHDHTAKLPLVDIVRPPRINGTSTAGSIRSGIFYGHLGGVEEIITRLSKEIEGTPKIVATGGFAELMAEASEMIDRVDENLTLEGLRMLHDSMSA